MKKTMTVLCVAALIGAVQPLLAAAPAPGDPIGAVYHINEVDKARGLLANVRNHLRDDPTTRIVVVANGGGIDWLLKDAVDKGGMPFAPALEVLSAAGVQFKVCRNTLAARISSTASKPSRSPRIASASARISGDTGSIGMVKTDPGGFAGAGSGIAVSAGRARCAVNQNRLP